jgi:adenine-specific DNA-methyltransferase
MNKQEIIHKIKSLEGFSQTERAYLIELINTKKKYGLVWEDKPEDVEDLLTVSLPILNEVIEKRVIGQNLNKNAITTKFELFDSENISKEPQYIPNHILIEGDNLHALTTLSYTHEGLVDVIYIDPPYNTGNKDFKYNDTFVDKEDGYRHSKWLSFMYKRLVIAKKLLSLKGVLFINIDDNEQAQLKLLCDEVFSESNFIAQIVWQKRTSPDSRRILGPAHDNIYCYGVSPLGYENLNHLGLTEEQENSFKNPDNDPNGPWVSSDFTAQGFRPNQMYEIVTPSGAMYLPPEGRCWKNIESVYKKHLKEGKMWFGVDGKGMPRRKTYLKERKGSVPWTWWDYKTSGSNQDAKKEIIDILNNSTAFITPKPIKLLQKIISIASDKNSTIIDFFAGSGTTLHATMLLNSEDEGYRKCILVTNNENNICEEVTYERNKRVINGYTNTKGINIQGLANNNLRYYKTEFVPSLKSEVNKRLLTKSSTDLLCIKEDCYNDITMAIGFNKKQCSILTNDTGKYLIVVYHSRQQLQVCEQLVDYIKTLKDISEKIRLYAFSPEKETLSEDFIEVADKIDPVPLPEAIYNAYRETFRVIKLDKKQPVSKAISAFEQESESPLFNPNQIEA